jgi:hypothetical protein
MPLQGTARIAPGASCKFGVRFAPTVTGSLTAAINLIDNATNSAQSVALTGTGTGQ